MGNPDLEPEVGTSGDFGLAVKLVRPRKTDLSIERIVLVWTPWRVGPDGIAEPAS